MTLSDQRLDILRKVERGDLSTEDASRLLEALEMGLPLEPADLLPATPEIILPVTPEAAPSAALAPDVEVIPAPMPPAAGEAPQFSDLEASRFNFWQRWWLLPFGIGVV